MARRGALNAPELIAQNHLVSGFTCGNRQMDAWLVDHALANEARASRTYVVADDAGSVVAYYSLAMGALERAALPRALRHDLPREVPVAVLGRLAIDNEHSGQGLGGALLAEALQRTLRLSAEIGVRGMIVHAIDDQAAAFYRHFGFVDLPGSDRTLLMTVETMSAAVSIMVSPRMTVLSASFRSETVHLARKFFSASNIDVTE